MLIFLFFFTSLSIIKATFINAVEKSYPFKIDFILIQTNNNFMNGNTYSTVDSQIHTIVFKQANQKKPQSVLLSLTKLFFHSSWNGNYLKYSFILQSITDTGLNIKTEFLIGNINQHVLLAYMTIINGYGIQLIELDLSSSFNETIQNKMSICWQSDIIVEDSEDFSVTPFVTRIILTSFTKNDLAIWGVIQNINKLKITLWLSTGTLSELKFFFLIYRKHKYESTLGISFPYYIFEITQINYLQTASSSYLYPHTNTSSNIYLFGVIHSGNIRNTWTYAVSFNYGGGNMHNFNSLLLQSRQRQNPSTNLIYAHIGVNSNIRGTKFSLKVIKCTNSLYKYLLINTQRCYLTCPYNYYPNHDNVCFDCKQCSHISHCGFCSKHICNVQQYYHVSNYSCGLCIDFDQNCISCPQGVCISCRASSLTILVGDLCICNTTMYYNSSIQKCESCSYKCLNCNNSNECISCQFPFKLTPDFTCSSCQEEYLFIVSNTSCKLKIEPFQFNLLVNNFDDSNIITIFVHFEGDVVSVEEDYNNEWKINHTILDPILTIFQLNNTLKAQFSLSNKYGNHFVQVRFIVTGNQDFLRTKQKGQYLNIQFQQNNNQSTLSNSFAKVINSISENSGIIVSALSITSLLNYVLGVLWDFQIVSFYIFLNVTKPQELDLFLQVTLKLQNIQLIPFQIPNPFSEDCQISQNSIYDKYDTDIYFIRSKFDDLICLVVFSLFYYSLFLIFRKCNPTNLLFKMIKTKMVDQVYVNISILFMTVVTAFAFTSSASLSNLFLKSNTHFANYGCSIIGLLASIILPILHSILLSIYKEDNNWDLDDCYLGFKREKKYSEIAFTVFIITRLIMSLSIPLFHPVFTISIIIAGSMINFIFLIFVRTVKFRIFIYYRIISQLSFILYNLMYLIYYIIQTYFQDVIKDQSFQLLGWISIFFICLVLFLQLLEMFTQMALDLYRFIRKCKLKTKIINLRSEETQENNVPQEYFKYTKRKNKEYFKQNLHGKIKSNNTNILSQIQQQNIPSQTQSKMIVNIHRKAIIATKIQQINLKPNIQKEKSYIQFKQKDLTQKSIKPFNQL